MGFGLYKAMCKVSVQRAFTTAFLGLVYMGGRSVVLLPTSHLHVVHKEGHAGSQGCTKNKPMLHLAGSTGADLDPFM